MSIENKVEKEGSEISTIVAQQKSEIEKLEGEQNKLEADLSQVQQDLDSLPPPPQPHRRAITNWKRDSFFGNSASMPNLPCAGSSSSVSGVAITPSLPRHSLAGNSAVVETPGLSRRALSTKIPSN
jgi:hypothetical protein